MTTSKTKLLSSTVIWVATGIGLAAGAAIPLSAMAFTSSQSTPAGNPDAVKKDQAESIQLAAGCNPCNPCAAAKACNPCNPCASKNPCNPCAASNPCNPCAGACNPCNPCAAAAGGMSDKCNVPRLMKAAYGDNPCAAKKGCNPCNPCAAKNPCNPCAAACSPCNPCGAAGDAEITPDEARTAYDCLRGEMQGYARSGIAGSDSYTGWENVATAPYQSATHGSRYVNNYVNDTGAEAYKKYEDIGKAPVGTVVAKDSFVAHGDGKLSVGPLFMMEKMPDGFNEASGNWKYTMVMPDGNVAGVTDGPGSDAVEFCIGCHAAVGGPQDHLFFLPEEFRKR